jgi:hypothetical protein
VRASCSWLSVDGLAVVARFAAPATRICSNEMPPSGYSPYFFTSNSPSSQIGLRQYVLKCFNICAGSLVILKEEMTYLLVKNRST